MKQAYTQKEHTKINRREYPGTREMCCICQEPTGRAGRGEDSIYVTFKEKCHINWVPPFAVKYHEGQELGPLCSECLDVLLRANCIYES